MRGDSANPATESENSNPLLCPHCDYNLTGLPENRCPECGQPFDPSDWRKFHPATPWENNRNLRGFWKTWWITVASPRRFAAGFHAHHDPRLAGRYSWICYGVAVGLFWASNIVTTFYLRTQSVDALILLISITLGTLPAMWVCEAWLAGLLGDRIGPRGGGPANDRWRGLLHHTSGFSFLTALWGGPVLAYVASSRTVAPILPGLAVLLAAGVFLHWTIALSMMVLQGESPALPRALSCALFPLVGLLSIGLGLLFSAMGIMVTLAIGDFD